MTKRKIVDRSTACLYFVSFFVIAIDASHRYETTKVAETRRFHRGVKGRKEKEKGGKRWERLNAEHGDNGLATLERLRISRLDFHLDPSRPPPAI